MPFAKIRSARSRISSLVTVLLMTRRSRSEPVSGAMVMRALAALAQHADDRLGQIVEPERRRADGVAHLEQAARGCARCPDGRRARSTPGRRGSNACAPRARAARMRSVGKRPDRQVVVAGPAEAAQVGAAADDFDEEARSELGVGREDAGRRRIDRVGRLQRRLPHRQRRVDARRTRVPGQRAVVRIVRLVERRDVEAALGGEQPQQVVAIGRRGDGAAQAGNQHFAFARGDHVGERRERLRVDERDGAADDDERMPRRCARRRSAGTPARRSSVRTLT